MFIGEKFAFRGTILMSLFSFYSPMPSIIRDLSQTSKSPALVPVTAISLFGIKTVFVKCASDLSFPLKSFFSILGE